MNAFELAQECAKNAIEVTLTENGYAIYGFSKSGTCFLQDTPEGVIATTRYERKDKIESFDDLVLLAYEWWHTYRDVEVFENPHPGWLPLFVKNGLLEEIKTITYKPIVTP